MSTGRKSWSSEASTVSMSRVSKVATRGEGAARIEDESVSKALHGRILHLLEIAERVRIGEFTVFAETLLEIAALHVVEAAGVAAIVAGEDAALFVDFAAKGIAAAL